MNSAGPVGFDLDLTLIDSRAAIMAAWSAVAADTGTRIDLSDVDRRMGDKLEDEVARWFPPPEREQAAARYRQHYVRLAPALTTALPGAHAALAAVRAAGRRAVIITAKHAVSVAPSLLAAALEADEVVSHVHGPEKAEVLSRIGAAAYVGDTPADMRAATRAGAVAVGAATGSFGPAELRAAWAGIVLASLAEFPGWYASFRAGADAGRSAAGTAGGLDDGRRDLRG
jgi:phosphoglycolate phosphatase